MNTPEPLTAEEEAALWAYASSPTHVHTDEADDPCRLLATLDRERAEHAALREKARAYLANDGNDGRYDARAMMETRIALRAALDEVKG